MLGLGRDERAADFPPLETARHEAACGDGRADDEGNPQAAQETPRHDHAEDGVTARAQPSRTTSHGARGPLRE